MDCCGDVESKLPWPCAGVARGLKGPELDGLSGPAVDRDKLGLACSATDEEGDSLDDSALVFCDI